jgi:hypothetical protein
MAFTSEPDVKALGAPSPRAAWLLLVAGVGVFAAATLLLMTSDSLPVHVMGYALSTFILIGIVARYRWLVVRLRADRSYAHVPMLDRVGTALVVLGIAVAAGHVWPIATELSR